MFDNNNVINNTNVDPVSTTNIPNVDGVQNISTVSVQTSNIVNDSIEKNEVQEEEKYEEGDLVFDENFEIEFEVADVSEDNLGSFFQSTQSEIQSTEKVNLGSEQSGNITF